MFLGCESDSEFLSLFRAFYRSPPSTAAVELLTKLALEVWYGELKIEYLIKSELSGESMNSDQTRRALYLVDRLISFPCLSNIKAKPLQSILKSWGDLKDTPPSKVGQQLFMDYKLDKKALRWGLEEDITAQMKSLLKYQTRHFAAVTGKRTGYSG